MGVFSFFKKKDQSPSSDNRSQSINNKQLIVVQFFYGIQDLSDLHVLISQLHSLTKESKIGSYEGHELSMDFGDGYLFLDSDDADKLVELITPILEAHYFMDKAIVSIRKDKNQNIFEKDYLIRFKKLMSSPPQN